MNQAQPCPRVPRIGIVGSGPAGWYAADALLKSGASVTVDIFERLPAPYGLVRYGVAPDHPEIKLVERQFDRIAAAPAVSFFGNVTVGRDVAVADLRRVYDALILATGMPRHRTLAIPGEDLPGSHGADEFVGWYNGHPDVCHREFDLSGEAAAVIGNGNVAIDVARILARSPNELRGTDITDHASQRLAQSRIRTIYVIGRRGPAQAAFTAAELGELADLESFVPVVDEAELTLEPACRRELDLREAIPRRKAYSVLERFPGLDRGNRPGRIRFLFRRSPVAIEGVDRVEGIRLGRNCLEGEEGHRVAVPLGECETVSCGLVVRCIGYQGVPLDGVPFDPKRGTIPNASGRVLDPAPGAAGVYAVGWIQHGPRGLIGTTKKESARVAQAMLQDLAEMGPPGGDMPEGGIAAWLDARRVRFTSYADWKTIDLAEQSRGREAGKPREKFCSVEAMLTCLDTR